MLGVPRISSVSRDPDEFSEMFSQLVGPIKFWPLQQSEPFIGCLQGGRLPRITLTKIKFRNCRQLHNHKRDFKAITFVLKGSLSFAQGNGFQDLDVHMAAVQNPNDTIDIMNQNAENLLLQFDSASLNDYIQKVCQGEDSQLLDQPLTIPLSEAHGRSLFRSVSFLWNEIQQASPLLQSPLVVSEHENLLFSQLIQIYAILAGRDKRAITGCSSLAMQQVRDYIVANLDRPISVADMAAVAGVSDRVLFKSFKDCYGTTPIQFLKRQRLESVHEALQAADRQTTTVTQVATDYGFNHLGRFSGEYFKMFQESPKETLRR